MPVILFNERFAEKVRLGEKQQTIRKPRKRPIKSGDKLSLRRWSGKPYRSKQVLILDAVCESVIEIGIWNRTVGLKDWGPFGGYLEDFTCEASVQEFETKNIEALAKADGFDRASDMFDWFEKTYGNDFFNGVLIRWRSE